MLILEGMHLNGRRRDFVLKSKRRYLFIYLFLTCLLTNSFQSFHIPASSEIKYPQQIKNYSYGDRRYHQPGIHYTNDNDDTKQ